MRLHFADLLTINRQLIKDLKVRAGQGDMLQQSLKKVKAMISKAGNLRSKYTIKIVHLN